MKKNLCIFTVAALAALSLTACKTTSTSTTTITTDINGQKTTKTVNSVTENGKTTVTTTEEHVNTNETAAETTAAETAAEAGTEADERTMNEKWHEIFTGGAEGENANGDHFYYAYDDLDDLQTAALMITNADGSSMGTYYLGDVREEDDWLWIYDVANGQKLPYGYTDREVENGFELTFQDGDVAVMHFVDQDTIIDDMLGAVDHMHEIYASDSQAQHGIIADHEASMDISGCSTFTQIVDEKMADGSGYANVTVTATDVLLVSDEAYQPANSDAQSISAELYVYDDDQKPMYIGYVRGGSTSTPLTEKDGMLYAASHHYVGKYAVVDNELQTVEEAWETFDENGNPTYHYNSDDGGSYDSMDQDELQSIYMELSSEYAESDPVVFCIENK